jgi:hypothetical protein
MEWLRNLFSNTKKIDRNINKYINKFGEIYIHTNPIKTANNLDMDKISMHICDTEYKIIHASCDSVYDFGEFMGKHIYEIEPNDIAMYIHSLHKIAQETKQGNILHLLMNEKLIFVSVRPLLLYNNNIFGSVGIIIPYKSI